MTMTTTTDPARSAAPPPGDAPRVPRPKPSAATVVLAVFAALVVGSYAALAYSDYELGSPARAEIPASVRSSQGGYRSFHFWHSGYHGGK
jgi:hypothetical protein